MKHLYSLIIFFLFSLDTVQSQTQEIAKFQYKKGIYETFENFRDNKPTKELNYAIIPKSKVIGSIFSDKNFNVYRLDISAKQKDSVGSPYGICDGTNFYFNKSISTTSIFNVNPRTEFYKMENYGRYTTYKAIGSSSSGGFSMGAGGMMMSNGGSSVNVLIDYIINMETGYIVGLDKKVLKKILADDEELAGLFDQDKHKKTLMLDYLLWYNKKHPL
jgi:hypothetical protein